MRHAFGFSPEGKNPTLPLEHVSRCRFDTASPHAQGYFEIISPIFNKYANRDTGLDIYAINVMFALQKSDLEESLDSLKILRSEIEARPRMWREYLGEITYPGRSPEPLNPLLSQSRALRIVDYLEKLLKEALRSHKALVYGNGVCYRALLGIELPAGVEEYS